MPVPPCCSPNSTPKADGVTCSVCHQIASDGFGRKSSFTAGFRIAPDDRIFGPHPEPFSMPMRHHTGYQPAFSRHVLDSALCATCHTVITPTLDATGAVAGEFVEQAPFLEWLASSFPSEGSTCQSCHLPVLDSPAYIAHRPPGGPFPPTSPRSPFGRHFFSGGNLQVPAMLAEIYPDRSRDFQDAAARARNSLSKALQLQASVSTQRRLLEVTVDLKNHTGHKLPTGYPSRRLWLHLTAFDASGGILFESGAWNQATGELRDASPVQPHHSSISSSSQVVIYEAELLDSGGQPTPSLLRAASYAKDNRLLPRGFDLRAPMPDGIAAASIAPVGTSADPDFRPGADRITYRIPLPPAARPSRVTVEALFQSIKPSHATATAKLDHPDARLFARLFRRHSQPAVLASVDLVVSPSP